ncbi:MAG TPA: hypothetical protein VGJ39_14040 [Vicinamibacterales bacterium]
MTVSLAQNGEGLGAMRGREKATAMLEVRTSWTCRSTALKTIR